MPVQTRALPPRKVSRGALIAAKSPIKVPSRTGVGLISLEQSGPDNAWETPADMRVFFPDGAPQKRPTFTSWDSWLEIFKKNSFISSCCRLIAESLISGGLQIVPAEEDGKIAPANQKILENFLETFHPYYSSDEFWRAEFENLALASRCYVEVCYNQIAGPDGRKGQPAALYDLPQGTIWPQPLPDGLFDMGPNGLGRGGTAFVQVLKNREHPIEFSWSQILWLRLPGMRAGSLNPTAPIELLTIPATTTIESEKYIQSYFTSGGKMGLILENLEWTKEKAEEMRRYYEKNYTDSSKGHKLLILYDGTTVKEPPKQSGNWAQFVDVQSFDREKVCGVFNTDAALISRPTGSSLGGRDQREALLEEFHINNINPKKALITRQLTKQIVQYGFGIFDAKLELTPYKSRRDATSMQILATTYDAMTKSNLFNVKKLEDLNHARQQIDDGFEIITEKDHDEWPGVKEPEIPPGGMAPDGSPIPGGAPGGKPPFGGNSGKPGKGASDGGTAQEERYNPFHGADGKFSSSDSAAMHVPKGGKGPSWKATPGTEALGPGGGRTGLSAKVTTAAGVSIPSRYALVHAKDVQASHLERSGAKNPAYPQGVQNREFNNNVVSDIARNLNPDLALDPGYSAEAGPTVVTEHEGGLVAVGGNHRLMGIQRAARENPEAFERYHAQLKADAARYGIDPASVRPGDVLVRQITNPGDVSKIERLGRDMNESRVTDYDTKGDAVTHGQNLSESTKGIVSRQFDREVETSGDKATLSKMLGKPESISILHAMIKDGSIPKGKLNTYVAKDGGFTTAGKNAVTAALVGHVINDADTIRELPAKAFKNISEAVPHLVRGESSAPHFQAVDKVRKAAALIVAAKGVNIEQHLEQAHFVEGSTTGVKPEHPGHEVVRLANAMRTMGSRKFASMVKKTVSQASQSGGMFGTPAPVEFGADARAAVGCPFDLIVRRVEECSDIGEDADDDREFQERYNPNHDGKGLFTSGSGGGAGHQNTLGLPGSAVQQGFQFQGDRPDLIPAPPATAPTTIDLSSRRGADMPAGLGDRGASPEKSLAASKIAQHLVERVGPVYEALGLKGDIHGWHTDTTNWKGGADSPTARMSVAGYADEQTRAFHLNPYVTSPRLASLPFVAGGPFIGPQNDGGAQYRALTAAGTVLHEAAHLHGELPEPSERGPGHTAMEEGSVEILMRHAHEKVLGEMGLPKSTSKEFWSLRDKSAPYRGYTRTMESVARAAGIRPLDLAVKIKQEPGPGRLPLLANLVHTNNEAVAAHANKLATDMPESDRVMIRGRLGMLPGDEVDGKAVLQHHIATLLPRLESITNANTYHYIRGWHGLRSDERAEFTNRLFDPKNVEQNIRYQRYMRPGGAIIGRTMGPIAKLLYARIKTFPANPMQARAAIAVLDVDPVPMPAYDTEPDDERYRVAESIERIYDLARQDQGTLGQRFNPNADETDIFRYNPNHDANGQFTTGAGGAQAAGEKIHGGAHGASHDSHLDNGAAAPLVKAQEAAATTPPPPGQVYNPNPADGKAARVGVPGDSVPPPPAEIPRLPNLTPEERAEEHAFASAFEKNPDGMAKSMIDKLAAREFGDGPNVFGTDDAKNLVERWKGGTVEVNGKKELTPETKEYRALYNTSLHGTANALAKRAFVQYLDTVVSKLPDDQRSVLVTAGGVASGKGYAISQVPEVNALAKASAAVWDTAGEQNSTEIGWVAKEAAARGIKVTAVYVHADPDAVWTNPDRGVVQRAGKQGRMVDARLFADSYSHGARNFAAFQEKFANDPNVTTAVLDNSKGAVPVRVPKVPAHVLAMDPDALYERSLKSLATAKVPDAVKRGGSNGVRIWPKQ